MPAPSLYITLAGAVQPTQHSSVSEERVLCPGICSVGSKEDSSPIGSAVLCPTAQWRADMIPLVVAGIVGLSEGVLPEQKSLFFSTDSRFIFPHIRGERSYSCYLF